MSEEIEHTVEKPSVDDGARARQLAGLRPPWQPGQSGNPSGLTKDGRPPKVAKLEASLLSELERSGGMSALAKRWVMLAKKGNATALSAILERLYPLPKEDPGAGRVVLEGLRLELTPGGGAVATMGRLEGPRSDADSSSSESRRGGDEMHETLRPETLRQGPETHGTHGVDEIFSLPQSGACKHQGVESVDANAALLVPGQGVSEGDVSRGGPPTG